jgi:hypothetical protein
MGRTLQFGAALTGVAALLLAAGVGAASAKGKGGAKATCAGGNIASGTYSQLTVTGACTVPAGADVTVTGNLRVAPGAMFDAQTDSHVAIGGNVYAGPGSSFGLGCTFAHPCSDTNEPPAGGSTHDTVRGNVVLDHVFNAAINGDTIGRNLVSTGGGAGLLNPAEQFIPFSIKDDVVHGNIVVTDLTTVWFGVIRTEVGKNLILKNINLSDDDGNEFVTDVIGRNLICSGNDPAPQVGDSEGSPDVVGGHALGQCAGLTG